MPRVIGIDPARSASTSAGSMTAPSFSIVRCRPPRRSPTRRCSQACSRMRTGRAPLDLVAGPSGYGLPLIDGAPSSPTTICVSRTSRQRANPAASAACASLMRELARLPMPVVLTPGVVHLASVPAHRKVNRVDMGTADKVCAAALARARAAHRHGCARARRVLHPARARRRVHRGPCGRARRASSMASADRRGRIGGARPARSTAKSRFLPEP